MDFNLTGSKICLDSKGKHKSIKTKDNSMPENIIDPFGSSVVSDYEHLFKELGVKPITPDMLKRIKHLSRYMRRGIDFAHRDFDKFLDAVEKGEPVAIMTGIKPTGEFHLGSKMTAEKVVYFQKEFNAKAFYCIADLEGFVDNNITLEKGLEYAVDNVADILALGLDPENAVIYRQSEQMQVMRLAFIASRQVTNNHLKALYGERPIGLYFAAFTQVGDILQPQLPEFGGPKIVLVPIGTDQDAHMRLTRDIARKLGDKFHFKLSTSVYHKFFRALDGSAKMSKRDTMTYLTLNDSPETVEKKLLNALTGGRGNVEEQKKLGGEPDKCIIYEMAKFHFVEDDNKLKQIREECLSGKRVCGDCKKEVIEIAQKFLKEHQEKKKNNVDKAKNLLGVG